VDWCWTNVETEQVFFKKNYFDFERFQKKRRMADDILNLLFSGTPDQTTNSVAAAATRKHVSEKLGLVFLPREFVRKTGQGEADVLNRPMFELTCRFPVCRSILGPTGQIDTAAFLSWIKLAAAEIKALPRENMKLRTYLVLASDGVNDENTAYLATQLDPSCCTGNIGAVRLNGSGNLQNVIEARGLQALFRTICAANGGCLSSLLSEFNPSSSVFVDVTNQRKFQFVTVVSDLEPLVTSNWELPR
jgi:hypothetical protein